MVLSANLCQQAKRPGGDAGVQGLIIAHKWQINIAQPEASSISRHRAANLLTFLGSFVLAGALGHEIQIAIAVSLFHKDVQDVRHWLLSSIGVKTCLLQPRQPGLMQPRQPGLMLSSRAIGNFLLPTCRCSV